MRLVHRALAFTFALATSAAAQTSAVPIQTKPLDPANVDRSVSACTDFYHFANGGWIKTHPVPAAYSRWPEAARLLINTDPHSPGVWRTNGPLSNMPQFAAAFGCKPGDPMVRDESVRPVIW